MRKLFTLWTMVGWFTLLWAQDPSILWQKTIGGSSADVVMGFKLLDNGNYLISGYSTSNISGEKTENSNGGLDIWITLVDPSGNILKQNTLGGSGDEYIFTLHPTSDGGYIAGASSNSNISGDKTENSRGGLDFWILKLDENFEITWQKTYGGNAPEFEANVFPTTDGGYFAVGYSDSGVSGDKTVPSQGQRDFWVLKLDGNGNISWQKSIGGALNDRQQMSFQTQDGGYMIGGYSNSNISGDKSENSRGLFDLWLVKMDTNGNIQWDKTYGGNSNDILRDIIPTSDGGYIIASYSESMASGEKSESTRGGMDYWIVKIDSNGTLQWEKTIGGSGIDYLRDILQLPNGNYLLSGYSNSNISGEKDQNSKGGYDLWILEINPTGEILGQNTIGGSGDESGPYVLFKEGNFYYALASDSNISGDKTENSRGLEDYWIFKANSSLVHTKEFLTNSSFTVYPNPNSGNFEIEFDKIYTHIQLEITDFTGITLLRKNVKNQSQIKMNTQLQPGVYLLKIRLNGHKTLTKKLLIK
jgi:hypothetical protein